MQAWEYLCPIEENHSSWIKVIQKSNDPHIEFLARLEHTIERTVIGEEARKHLLKMPSL